MMLVDVSLLLLLWLAVAADGFSGKALLVSETETLIIRRTDQCKGERPTRKKNKKEKKRKLEQKTHTKKIL